MSLLMQRPSTEQQLAYNVKLKARKLYFIKTQLLSLHYFEIIGGNRLKSKRLNSLAEMTRLLNNL